MSNVGMSILGKFREKNVSRMTARKNKQPQNQRDIVSETIRLYNTWFFIMKLKILFYKVAVLFSKTLVGKHFLKHNDCQNNDKYNVVVILSFNYWVLKSNCDDNNFKRLKLVVLFVFFALTWSHYFGCPCCFKNVHKPTFLFNKLLLCKIKSLFSS